MILAVSKFITKFYSIYDILHQGCSLSMLSSSTMQVNPDIGAYFILRSWYDSSGFEQTFQANYCAQLFN